MSAINRIKSELSYYRRLAADPSVPGTSKWLLLGAIAYLISPIDLIPDFIPVLGQLDDLIIVPSMIWLALIRIPAATKLRAREKQTTQSASVS
jgi:uncharacterized membrane protein YkvA (DUF1232 family)